MVVYEANQSLVLELPSEKQRDSYLISVKRLLKAEFGELKAIPWLSELERTNKEHVYSMFGQSQAIRLVDWGNRTLVVSKHDDFPYKRAIKLAQDEDDFKRQVGLAA